MTKILNSDIASYNSEIWVTSQTNGAEMHCGILSERPLFVLLQDYTYFLKDSRELQLYCGLPSIKATKKTQKCMLLTVFY